MVSAMRRSRTSAAVDVEDNLTWLEATNGKLVELCDSHNTTVQCTFCLSINVVLS
jgi:hypothetical protein